MKIIAASISLLLPTATAFCNSQLATTTAISRGAAIRTALRNSYLEDLSNNLSSFSTLNNEINASLESQLGSTSSFSTSTGPLISKLTLNDADLLANGVIDNIQRNNFPPIVVTVVDRQANILVQKRMDDVCHAAFPEFSYAKAYTCVTMGVSSREFRDKYTATDDNAKIGQMNSMMAISGKMAAFPGGVLLRNMENEIIGAIGVSGAAGDEDEYVALAGAWESGLAVKTSPLEHSCTTVKQ